MPLIILGYPWFILCSKFLNVLDCTWFIQGLSLVIPGLSLVILGFWKKRGDNHIQWTFKWRLLNVLLDCFFIRTFKSLQEKTTGLAFPYKKPIVLVSKKRILMLDSAFIASFIAFIRTKHFAFQYHSFLKLIKFFLIWGLPRWKFCII